MGTLFVGLIVAGIVGAIIFGMVRNKKQGKALVGCGCDCKNCGGHCH